MKNWCSYTHNFLCWNAGYLSKAAVLHRHPARSGTRYDSSRTQNGTNCIYKHNNSFFCEQHVTNMSYLKWSVCVSTKSLPHTKWEESITTILQAADDAGTQIQNHFCINNNLWIEQCKLFCTYNIYSTVNFLLFSHCRKLPAGLVMASFIQGQYRSWCLLSKNLQHSLLQYSYVDIFYTS